VYSLPVCSVSFLRPVWYIYLRKVKQLQRAFLYIILCRVSKLQSIATDVSFMASHSTVSVFVCVCCFAACLVRLRVDQLWRYIICGESNNYGGTSFAETRTIAAVASFEANPSVQAGTYISLWQVSQLHRVYLLWRPAYQVRSAADQAGTSFLASQSDAVGISLCGG
jgi:hypothetical protein